MRATTRDGFVVHITPSQVGKPWLVKIDEPTGAPGAATCWGLKSDTLTAARAEAAVAIGWFRDREERRQEAASHLWRIAQRVMAAAELGMPGGRW